MWAHRKLKGQEVGSQALSFWSTGAQSFPGLSFSLVLAVVFCPLWPCSGAGSVGDRPVAAVAHSVAFLKGRSLGEFEAYHRQAVRRGRRPALEEENESV